jgi:hypothetical protein
LKKKIAIIIPGGIGGGNFLQGIPVVEDLVIKLSESFDVTVYSLIKTDPAYIPQNFILKHTGLSYKRSALIRMSVCSIQLFFGFFDQTCVLQASNPFSAAEVVGVPDGPEDGSEQVPDASFHCCQG